MPVESWLQPEEVPELAARATAMIDAALTGSGLARESYWAAVRKGYNTPYNDPPRKRAVPPAQPNAVPAPACAAVQPVAAAAVVIAAQAAEARAI